MPWTFGYNRAMGYVEIVYYGFTTAADLQESTSRCIAVEHELGVNRFLVDATDMELDATLEDVHDIPDKQYVRENADRHGRVAAILSDSPYERDAIECYRDTCRDQGWQVEAFKLRQEAVDWLTRRVPPGPGSGP